MSPRNAAVDQTTRAGAEAERDLDTVDARARHRGPRRDEEARSRADDGKKLHETDRHQCASGFDGSRGFAAQIAAGHAEQPHGFRHAEHQRIGGDRMADRDFEQIGQRR